MSGKPIRVSVNGKAPPGDSLVGYKHVNDWFRNQAIFTKMTVARTMLFSHYPFWGHLAMTIPFIEEVTGYVPTMGTDGIAIYYAVKFCNTYSEKQLATVIAHEINHNLRAHVGAEGRRGDRLHRRWNIAGDFTINADLIEMGMEMPTGFPYCYDPKYAGWATEAIYDDLERQGDEYEAKFSCMDTHMEVERDAAADAEIKQVWHDHVIRADSARRLAEESNMGNTNLPKGIRRLLGKLHEPKQDWRTLLRRFIASSMGRGYSYARPNRGAFQIGMTLPGFRKRTTEVDLAIAIDTSASTDEALLAKVISEILGVMRQVPKFKIAIWTFDHMVREDSFTILQSGAQNALEIIRPFLGRMEGGGATLFESNWEFMKRKHIRPKGFLMGTDGLPNNTWGDPTYCPTMFLIINEANIKAPFGMSIQYE